MQMDQGEERGRRLRHFHKIGDRNRLTVSRNASGTYALLMTKRRTAIGLFVLSEEFCNAF
jgi:hypothetical protein